MADGPAGFTQDFSCPALLRILLRFISLRVPAFHCLWSDFPNTSTHDKSCDIAVLHRLQEPRHPPYALSYLLTRHILLRAVSAESCTLRFSCFLNLYGFTFIAFICSYSFEIALEESCVVQYVKDHVQRFRCFVWRISDSNR